MSDQREKALGQFRLQISNVLALFDMHGLHIHIPEAVEQIVELSLKLHERLNGNDIPIQLKKKKIWYRSKQ